jgi:hypothetical protein
MTQVGLDPPAELWRKFQKICIVKIIGCHRPEAQIERGWEAVFLSIVNKLLQT